MSKSGRSVELKRQIREVLDEEFSREYRVQFVEDGGRLDVRVEPVGLVDDLESRRDDLTVSVYGDLRFTLMTD